jgi:hypothetical protein
MRAYGRRRQSRTTAIDHRLVTVSQGQTPWPFPIRSGSGDHLLSDRSARHKSVRIRHVDPTEPEGGQMFRSR